MSAGIIVAEKDVSGKLILDSRKPRLQVAMGRTPPHLGVEKLSGTAIQSNAGNGYFATETLFSMNHQLGYKPKVLLHIYDTDSGKYSVGKYVFAAGAFEEYFSYLVTDTIFSVVHVIDDTAINVGRTSTGGNIRVKYLIFSNPINAVTNPALR